MQYKISRKKEFILGIINIEDLKQITLNLEKLILEIDNKDGKLSLTDADVK